MSFPKTGRNVQSQDGGDGSGSDNQGAAAFARSVAAALRSEFGSGGSAVKNIAMLTGANERAVKNWFQGRNAPSAFHLVALARHSDDVLRLFLALSGREHALVPVEVAVARLALVRALAALKKTSN